MTEHNEHRLKRKFVPPFPLPFVLFLCSCLLIKLYNNNKKNTMGDMGYIRKFRTVRAIEISYLIMSLIKLFINRKIRV